MARKKPQPPVSDAFVEPVQPEICEATVGANGAVLKGSPIDIRTAVERRKKGLDDNNLCINNVRKVVFCSKFFYFSFISNKDQFCCFFFQNNIRCF